MRALAIAFSLCVSAQGFTQERKLFTAPSTTSEADHNHARAGMPMATSRLAKPSVEKHEGPGYIGGGKLIGGDARGPADGTFGWDYRGFGWRPGRVFLSWAHDRKHQPQLGPYKTDTRKVPDVLSFHPARRVLDENKGK